MEGRSYHLQRPHPPNPHFQRTLDALNVLQLDAFPPTPPGRFPPKEQQLLRHADRVVVGHVAFDVGSEPRESETADDGFVGLAGSMAPAVVVVETA